MICQSCRSEIEPVMVICPSCGARLPAKGESIDWRQQVRETVQRHKQRKKVEQEKRDDEARQLSIFPEAAVESEEERTLRERHAEIRARVEDRVRKDRPARRHPPALDAGEIALSRGGAAAAASRLSYDLGEDEKDEKDEKDDEPDPTPARFEELDVPPRSEHDHELDLELGPAGPALDADGTSANVRDGSSLADSALSTPGERLLSGLIDLAFVALIQLTLFYLTTHLVSQRLGSLPTNAVAAMSLVGIVMGAGYFLFFWSLSGQTLGKLLTGTRVVNARGGALGFGRAAVRLAGSLVALLPLGLGFIGLFTEPARRGWHDRLAGSKVVRS